MDMQVNFIRGYDFLLRDFVADHGVGPGPVVHHRGDLELEAGVPHERGQEATDEKRAERESSRKGRPAQDDLDLAA